MPFILKPEHQRAIGSLSYGCSVSEVAAEADVSMNTIYRWLQIPEFKATLEQEIKTHQVMLPILIQVIATESIEAQIETQRELRAYMLGGQKIDHSRLMAMQVIMKYGQRWLDLAGFNANKKGHAQLAIFQPDNPLAEQLPDDPPADSACAPGDRATRPATEFDAPPRGFGNIGLQRAREANAEKEAERAELKHRAAQRELARAEAAQEVEQVEEVEVDKVEEVDDPEPATATSTVRRESTRTIVRNTKVSDGATDALEVERSESSNSSVPG